MQKIGLLLIALLLSFSALSQNKDSTLCFTTDQVKTFLRTKVELQNALETNQVLYNRLVDSEEIQADQLNQLEKKAKKLKRTRAIAGTTGGLALLFGLLLFI